MQRLLVIRMRHQKLPVTHCSCVKALQATTYMFVDAMKAIGLFTKFRGISLHDYALVSTYKTIKLVTTAPTDPQRKIAFP